MKKLLLIVIVILLGHSISLADFTGKMTRVIDGDTVEILTTNHPDFFNTKKLIRIRLADIDAPETGQAFGEKARQLLAQIALNGEITVKDHGTDRYNRTLGTLYNTQCFSNDCQEVDINAQMVISGMAWVYRYKNKASNENYLQYEEIAKNESRGLWFDKKPIEPWKWRKNNK